MICDESGTILDDGTVARIADDEYYVTTSSGNIDSIEQWMKMVAIGTDRCVHIVNMTSGMAAVNLAGPEARGILSSGLSDVDISQASFPVHGLPQGQCGGCAGNVASGGFRR